jgi:hypothetical protein
MSLELLKQAHKERKSIRDLQTKVRDKQLSVQLALLQYVKSLNIKSGQFYVDNRDGRKVIIKYVPHDLHNLKVLAKYVDLPSESIQLLEIDEVTKKYYIEHFSLCSL